MTEWNYALVSLGATATALNSDGGFPPFQAIDGSPATVWKTTWSGNHPQLTIDLGAPQYITQVVTRPYWAGVRADTWQLSYSFDGTTWQVITGGIARDADVTTLVEPITARYWRLYGSNNGSATYPSGLKSVEVVGPIEAPPPPVSPAPTYIAAWLDGINANYVPAAQAWIDENWG